MDLAEQRAIGGVVTDAVGGCGPECAASVDTDAVEASVVGLDDHRASGELRPVDSESSDLVLAGVDDEELRLVEAEASSRSTR